MDGYIGGFFYVSISRQEFKDYKPEGFNGFRDINHRLYLRDLNAGLRLRISKL